MRKRLFDLPSAAHSRRRMIGLAIGAISMGAALALIPSHSAAQMWTGWALALFAVCLVSAGVLQLLRQEWRVRRAREASRTDPTNPALYYELALACERRGDVLGSLTAFREAIHLDVDLDILDHRETANILKRRYGANARDAKWIDAMAHHASLDYAIEHAESMPSVRGHDGDPRGSVDADRRHCRAVIESLETQLAGTEQLRDSLSDFVEGYGYYETKESLEEEIRQINEQLDELREILRELEDA